MLLSIAKLQNLKAIHNSGRTLKEPSPRCYQSQNYKIWKQFTTFAYRTCYLAMLLSIAKLQNLKAIHNRFYRVNLFDFVVINRKTTKFESNSQPSGVKGATYYSCYQSQNYKIWKQFTTQLSEEKQRELLLSIAKLQNLKAIHNCIIVLIGAFLVVINHKTTKFESNSQPYQTFKVLACCCYQSQNYKIWKQFTTNGNLYAETKQLLSITKLQNLKAIHNVLLSLFILLGVVINHKTTKFESNSQLNTSAYHQLWCCYQSQNYKIWKQFTT